MQAIADVYRTSKILFFALYSGNTICKTDPPPQIYQYKIGGVNPRLNQPLDCLIGGYHFSSHVSLFGEPQFINRGVFIRHGRLLTLVRGARRGGSWKILKTSSLAQWRLDSSEILVRFLQIQSIWVHGIIQIYIIYIYIMYILRQPVSTLFYFLCIEWLPYQRQETTINPGSVKPRIGASSCGVAD